MLLLSLLFLMLIAGVAIGPRLADHQGHVLIQTDSYQIETSVTALVVAVVLLLIVIFVVKWLLRRIFHYSAHTCGRLMGGKRSRARKQMQAALIKLAEGDYKQVEKLLIRNADHAEQPMINYLLAAKAAQQRNDKLITHQYIERASAVANDDDQLPVDITRVRIQLAQGEAHAARQGIEHLLSQASHHPEVLRLAEQTFLCTQDYASLLAILPRIEKVQIHDDTQLQALWQQTYIGLMAQCVAKKGNDGLKKWWREQSRKIRHQVPLQVAFIEHLIAGNDHKMAQQALLNGLKRQYDERLISLMPRLNSGDLEPLEQFLRQQIKKCGTTPLLNSTLGQLLLKHGDWQAASEAFHTALQQRPDAYDYALLADALDKLHLSEDAAQIRHKGLLLTLQQNSTTTRPAPLPKN